MLTHVALLRGINVGGRNRVTMADLRDIVTSLGHADVATYIQSGNVLFKAGSKASATALAEALETAIAARLTFRPKVMVLARPELTDVIAANPFPDETDPKRLHAMFRTATFPAAEITALTEAVDAARKRGSTDEMRIIGRTLYLRTPDGLGRSLVAARFTRPEAGLTARNWATVTKLAALLEAS
ncbi:MAG: DUF1697 domain-containing protein [Candidatus Limnocylindrales bacterium]